MFPNSLGTENAPAARPETLPPGLPELSLGHLAALWAEAWLRQPNGPRAGKPFRLTYDQYRFLLWWYAIDREGRWLYDHGARRLAKGSGKSPFAAVLALIEFCAPVRLERFDDRADFGVRGRPVDMPLIQIVATAESQTANTMRMVRAFAPKGSQVVDEYKLDPGKTLYYKLPEGTLEVKTSSATAAEGAEASFVVADETEHWKPSNGGPELAATLADNLSKSGSRMLETSNAWTLGSESVAEATWGAYCAQEEGRLVEDAARILYDARIAAPDTDIYDRGQLEAALQHVYGDCDWKRTADGTVDVRPIIRRIYSPAAKVDDSLRKYLNWPTAAADAWLEPEQWTRLARPDIQVKPGTDVVLFFDGSKSRDGTALIGCTLETGHVFTCGVWEPNPAHDSDETVDVADVERILDLTFQALNPVAFFADVREWESYALSEWPRKYGDRLTLWAVPSGRPPQQVAWDMRSHKDEFAKAAEACHAEIVEGLFTHDGHPATTRHVVNARRRPYKDMVSIGKESADSPKKIDAAVCVIGARMVRRLALAATSTKKKRTGGVW